MTIPTTQCIGLYDLRLVSVLSVTSSTALPRVPPAVPPATSPASGRLIPSARTAWGARPGTSVTSTATSRTGTLPAHSRRGCRRRRRSRLLPEHPRSRAPAASRGRGLLSSVALRAAGGSPCTDRGSHAHTRSRHCGRAVSVRCRGRPRPGRDRPAVPGGHGGACRRAGRPGPGRPRREARRGDCGVPGHPGGPPGPGACVCVWNSRTPSS